MSGEKRSGLSNLGATPLSSPPSLLPSALFVPLRFSSAPPLTSCFSCVLVWLFRRSTSLRKRRVPVSRDLRLADAAEQGSDVLRKSLIQLAGQPLLEFRPLRRSQRLELQSHKAAFPPPAHLRFGKQLAGTLRQAEAKPGSKAGVQSGGSLDSDPTFADVYSLAQKLLGLPRSNKGGNRDGAPEVAPPLTHNQSVGGPQRLTDRGSRKRPLQHKSRVWSDARCPRAVPRGDGKGNGGPVSVRKTELLHEEQSLFS